MTHHISIQLLWTGTLKGEEGCSHYTHNGQKVEGNTSHPAERQRLGCYCTPTQIQHSAAQRGKTSAPELADRIADQWVPVRETDIGRQFIKGQLLTFPHRNISTLIPCAPHSCTSSVFRFFTVRLALRKLFCSPTD